MEPAKGPSATSSPLGRSLLALLVFDLFFIQIHVFRLLKLEIARRGLPGSPRSLVTVLTDSARPDVWIPLVGLGLLLVALIGLEWRRRELSGLLMRATASPGGAALTTAIVVLVGARYCLDAGLPHQFDAKLHFMRVSEVARQLAEGRWPDWSFAYYAGFPLLRFAGPAFYLSAGGLSLLTGSVAAAVKIVLLTAHVGGSLAVFRLTRRLGGTPRGAFLAAVGVAISFQHTSAVVLAGRHPVALLYLFFPLMLLAGEGIARGFRWRSALGFGLAAGMLFLSHPGLAPYGVLIGVLFTVIRGLTLRGRSAIVGGAVAFAVGGAVCVVICAGLVFPAFAERPHVHLASMYTATGLAVDLTPDLGEIARVAMWNLRWSGASVAYLGLSLLALFAILAFRPGTKRELRFPLVVTALVLLFLTGGGYLSARCVHYLVPIVAVGAGLAAEALPRRAYPLAVLLVLLDLGPTTFQTPFRPDLEDERATVRAAADAADGHRILRVSRRAGQYAVSEWASVYDVDAAMPTGPFREGADADYYPWMHEVLRRLESELNASGGFSETSVGELCRLDVRLLLFEDGKAFFLPEALPLGVTARTDIPAVEVDGASPVFGRPVDRFRRTSHEIAFRVVTAEGGTLVLSLANLPGLTIAVDGETRPVSTGPHGLATIQAEPGDHEIRASFVPSRLLAGTRTLSLAGLAVFLALFVTLALRRQST